MLLQGRRAPLPRFIFRAGKAYTHGATRLRQILEFALDIALSARRPAADSVCPASSSRFPANSHESLTI
jgi:hypothetical protein